MSINFDGDRIVQWVITRWERKSTIAFLMIILALFLAWLFAGIDLTHISKGEAALILIIPAAFFIFWYKSTAIPKASKGRIGFAVAIACESKAQKRTITADFIDTLRNLIERGSDTQRFTLVNIPEYHANRIISIEDARRVRKRARCNFIVYGNAKEREIGGRKKHVLDLGIQVTHRPVPTEVSKRLSKEMVEVFPLRLRIDKENDLISFDITSEWVDCVSRYIISIAAFISGDLNYSETLFLSVLQNRILRETMFPPLVKIRQRIPIHLGEIYAYHANESYELWRKDRDPIRMEESWNNVKKLRNFSPNNYNGHLAASIYYFVSKRDIDAAIRECQKCRDQHDATWRYSYAFLLAYRGDMRKARRMYRNAFQHYYNRVDVPFQTEEFMKWVLDEEPDKVQLHFCLGLVNWKAKGDLERAVQDFGDFIKADGSDDFPEEMRLAEAYMSNLEGELKKRSAET